MNMRLSMEQLREIILLAKQCQEHVQPGWYSMQDTLEDAKERLLNSDTRGKTLRALRDYLERLDYDELLEVEALMQYGRDVLLRSEEERDSLDLCVSYIKSIYGGEKGSIDGAINYIVDKKEHLAKYLEAAYDSIDNMS